jgi:nucleoside-diphosphate-sugar epimerase
MSTLLVTGGTGALGRHIVARLRERGDDVRVLSRRPGAGTHVGDLSTGEGVAEAARDAELVVHAASDTFRRLGRSDLDQTRNLLDAAKDANHLLYVSIVGIDSIPYVY